MATAKEVAEHLHEKREKVYEHWENEADDKKRRIREVHDHLLG